MSIAAAAAAMKRRQRERALRRGLRAVLVDAGIDTPRPITEVCTLLGERRGRPIVPVAWEFDAGDPYGAWLPTNATDWIFYQAATTQAHQAHIIAHELGHLLAGHTPEGSVSEDIDTGAEPPWPRRALRRTSYDTQQERDAEVIATLLLHSAAATVVQPSGTDRARSAQHSLGDRLDWL